MDIKAYVKAHPWQVGIIVVVGGIVFLLFSGIIGGGSSQAAVAGPSGPSDAQVAAQAAIQSASIGASASAQHDANQLSLAALQAQNSVDLATIAANTQTHQDDLSAHLGELNTQTSFQALLAQLQQGLGLANINADLQENLATTNANLQRDMYNAQVGALTHLNDNATSVTLAQNQAQKEVALGNIATQQQYNTGQYLVQQHQLDNAGLAQTYDFQTTSHAIDANTQLQLGQQANDYAQIFSNERLGANQQAANVAIAASNAKGKNKSGGLLGGLIGSLF